MARRNSTKKLTSATKEEVDIDDEIVERLTKLVREVLSEVVTTTKVGVA